MTRTRWFFGSLLILAVIAVLFISGGIGLPGTWGIEREPAETSPAPHAKLP